MFKSSRKQKKSDEKSNPNCFSWTDDEVELLLHVTMDYKASKTMESIDWDLSKGDCDRDHIAISRQRFRKAPFSAVHTTPPSRRFQISPPWRPFSNGSVFGQTENAVFGVDGKFIRISVDWA